MAILSCDHQRLTSSPPRVLNPAGSDASADLNASADVNAGRNFQRWPILLGIALLVFVARLALATHFDLFADETLYAWQSSVMPGSFCPHPPGVLLMVKAGMALLGKTEPGVRLFPMLLSTLMLVPLWLLARDIGEATESGSGKRIAFWTCLAALAAPIYFALGVVTTPDGSQLFFWIWALFFAWHALDTGHVKWWLLCGIAVGLGLFVKYILVLFIPALFLCLMLVPQWRAHLKTPGPWLCMLAALALFVPPFLNHEYSHGWITVAYHLQSRQTRQLPALADIGVYQGIHAAYYSPLLYMAALAGFIWAGREGWKRRDGNLLFLFCFAAVPYVFFALIAAVTERGLSREQWDAPAYATALLAAVLWAHSRQKVSQENLRPGESDDERKRRTRHAGSIQRWGIAALGLGFMMSLMVMTEGVNGAISKTIGSKPLLTSLIGARQMAHAIDAQVEAGTVRPDFLVGNNFSTALSYAFYGRDLPYFTIGGKYNAKYGLVQVLRPIEIGPGFIKEHRGQSALLVVEEHIRPRKAALRRIGTLRELKPHFRSVRSGEPIDVHLFGHRVKRYGTFLCSGLMSTPQSWILSETKLDHK
jgi:hypothetical protein